MTDWGVEPTWWFRDGRGHKRSSLVRLREDLPEVSWVLVGDDSERDPALHEVFTCAHPGRRDRAAAGGARRPGRRRCPEVVGVPVVRGRHGHTLLPLLRTALA